MRELFKLVAFLVLVAALLAGIARAFFVNVVQTDSYSMVPTLVAGDTFLVFTQARLDLGDVAVCQDPEGSGSFVVGRVMAKTGDTLSIENDIVSFGRWEVETAVSEEMTYLDRTSGEDIERRVEISVERFGGKNYSVAHVSRGQRRTLKPVEVEDGLFLLGDNRNLARDSRDYGTVDPKTCLGRAFFLVEPSPTNGDLIYEKRRFTWIE